MATMASFHAEKCCQLVSEHKTSAGECSSSSLGRQQLSNFVVLLYITTDEMAR